MEWNSIRRAPLVPVALIGFMLGGAHASAKDAPEIKIQPPPRTPAWTIAQATPSGDAANKPRPAPGSFEVDEEAAERALERTLTQAGALLLRQGTVEVTPVYSFRRTESSAQGLVNITTNGGATFPVLATQKTRRNENLTRVDVRVGMPYNAQLEMSVPYNYVRSSRVTELGAGSTSANGQGIGDITLGAATTLMRESGWRPDLIGRLTYNTGSARREDNGVSLLGGYRQIQADVVAIKRQDPLAFVTRLSYTKSFEEDGVKPGDAVALSLTSVLAASPATSLQFGFSQVHRQRQERNGVKLSGSDETYGMAVLGASSVLSRDVTLVTQLGIGLGSDAPKYSFTVSLPILFR